MKSVLVTGFEPFGGDRKNPSAEIVQALDGRVIAGRRITGEVLPCVFGDSLQRLRTLIRTREPQVVLCLGLAGNRIEITPERVALNVDDARIADNAGRQPVDAPVVRGGPAAYWSTLPIKAIVAALRQRGLAASVSQTAGTFVCNHVFYGAMHELRRRRGVRAGFIHVPWPADWKRREASKLTLAQMIAGIETAIEVSLTRRADLKQRGGADA